MPRKPVVAWASVLVSLLAPTNRGWAAWGREPCQVTFERGRAVVEVPAVIMSEEERAYLQPFFGLLAQAVVERRERTQQLLSRSGEETTTSHYDDILAQLNSLQVPERLRQMHQLVVNAITEQRTVLDGWRTTGEAVDFSHPLVRSSSQKLQQAYQELLHLFPQEADRNRQAFYDCLCALDFI